MSESLEEIKEKIYNSIYYKLKYDFNKYYLPMENRGYTDKEIAEMFGVHYQTFSRYKMRQRKIDEIEQKKRIEELIKIMEGK